MEKNVNLKIAQYIKDELSTYNNVRVEMTRPSDVAVQLQQRVSIAQQQKADLFVNLHANSSNSSVTSGVEVFYPNGNLSVADYYHVIRETKKLGIPAVLIEYGYISNASDVSNYFSSDEKLQALARQNVKTLEKTLNLSKEPNIEDKISITTPMKTEYLAHKFQGYGFSDSNLKDFHIIKLMNQKKEIKEYLYSEIDKTFIVAPDMASVSMGGMSK